MRGEEEKNGNSAVKTLCTAIVIGTFVMVAAMIFVLYNANFPEEEKTFKTLLFGLSLGIPGLVAAFLGMMGLTHSDVRKYQIMAIIGAFVGFIDLVAAGVLVITMFDNLVIGICFIGVAVCILALCLVASPIKLIKGEKE